MASREFNPSPARRIRHRMEAAVFQVMVWAVPCLPRGLMVSLANGFGNLGHLLCANDRRVAMANLDIAFGETLCPAEKKKITRETFRNLSRTVFDLLWASKKSRKSLLKIAEFNEPELQHIRDLQAAKKGVILIIPHFGNWELSGLAFGAAGVNITTIAEPGVNPHIDDMITQARSSTGHKIVPPRNAMLTMVRAAMRSQPVALFIDVNARRGRGGIWLDFFGVPVYQSVAAAELAIRSKGSIVCCIPKSLPGGRIKVEFPGVFDSAETTATDHPGRVKELSEKTLRYYEDAIRRSPDQWLWTYKRWKRRPTETGGAFPYYAKYFAEEAEPVAKTTAEK